MPMVPKRVGLFRRDKPGGSHALEVPCRMCRSYLSISTSVALITAVTVGHFQ